jgi:hypothetical protein
MPMKRRSIVLTLGLGLTVALMVVGGEAGAFEQYSFVKNDNFPPPSAPAYNACRTCHGDFNSVATEQSGETWPDNLMATHLGNMVGGSGQGDCDACHNPGPRFPVSIGASAGGAGLDPISCSGCHGRSQDGTPAPGDGSAGYGLGLRRHHWNANVTIDLDPDPVDEFLITTRLCANCHADADPASGLTPVGEDVKPPYYADPNGGGSATEHAPMPSDACSDPTNGDNPDEEKVGDILALDNDGDLSYDMNDPDCASAVAAPGEVSGTGSPMVLVTAHDTQTISFTYFPTCGSTDNTIVFGPLSQVSTHAYSGETCGILNTGSVVWDIDAAGAPDSLFFLVVANDGTFEGSYGLGDGSERPNHASNMVCPFPQGLANRCD